MLQDAITICTYMYIYVYIYMIYVYQRAVLQKSLPKSTKQPHRCLSVQHASPPTSKDDIGDSKLFGARGGDLLGTSKPAGFGWMCFFFIWMVLSGCFQFELLAIRSHIFCATLCSDVCSHSKAAYSLKESTFRKKLPRKLAPILLACCSWPPRRSSHSQNCLNTKKVQGFAVFLTFLTWKKSHVFGVRTQCLPLVFDIFLEG